MDEYCTLHCLCLVSIVLSSSHCGGCCSSCFTSFDGQASRWNASAIDALTYFSIVILFCIIYLFFLFFFIFFLIFFLISYSVVEFLRYVHRCGLLSLFAPCSGGYSFTMWRFHIFNCVCVCVCPHVSLQWCESCPSATLLLSWFDRQQFKWMEGGSPAYRYNSQISI